MVEHYCIMSIGPNQLMRKCLIITKNMWKENTKNIRVDFDGYSDTNSTKVQEHNRWTTATSTSLEIWDSTKVTFTWEAFLGNTNNEDQLIKLLCARLEKGFSTIQCKGGADVVIVKSGIESAEVARNVVVIAEDTDVLILMYHWKVGMEELIFRTERKEKKKSKWFYWNVCDPFAAQSCPETPCLDTISLPMPGLDMTQLQSSIRKVNSITELLVHGTLPFDTK